MKLILSDTKSHFLTKFDSLLSKKQAQCFLTLQNTLSLQDTPCSPSALLGGVVDENDRPVLVFSMFRPYNLYIHTADETPNKKALLLLVAYFIKEKIHIPGIMAKKEVVAEFLREYEPKANRHYKKHISTNLLVLNTVKEVPLTSGVFREGRMDDIPLLSKWYVRFVREALHEHASIEEQAYRVQSRIQNGSLFIFEKDEEPVSTATVFCARGVACINAVFTPEVHRGKGYAQTLLYHICSGLCRIGMNEVCLYADTDNPVSNRLYERLGFVVLEDTDEYRLVSNIED